MDHQASDKNTITRRQLLQTAAGTGLFVLLPLLPAAAQDPVAPAAPVPPVEDNWVAVGPANQFQLDIPQRVSIKGTHKRADVFFVTRHSPTELSAVSAKCTHKGCEVAWDGKDTQFHCPCHGAVFAADGKSVHGPHGRTVAALPSPTVRQQEDHVEINLASLLPTAQTPPKK